MATFKPTVRGMRKDGFMQVYIRVTHHTKHGYIKNDKMVTKISCSVVTIISVSAIMLISTSTV